MLGDAYESARNPLQYELSASGQRDLLVKGKIL